MIEISIENNQISFTNMCNSCSLCWSYSTDSRYNESSISYINSMMLEVIIALLVLLTVTLTFHVAVIVLLDE